MMKVADVITDLIGNTPLLRVNRYAAAEGLATAPMAKLEYFNPAGSVKDRKLLICQRKLYAIFITQEHLTPRFQPL